MTPKEKAIEWLHNNASNLNNIYNALGNDVKVILAISNMLDIAISSERERIIKIIKKEIKDWRNTDMKDFDNIDIKAIIIKGLQSVLEEVKSK
jgi:hypothetical protein